jgi:hypothetical protein
MLINTDVGGGGAYGPQVLRKPDNPKTAGGPAACSSEHANGRMCRVLQGH